MVLSQLTIGLVVPIESYGHSHIPTMQQHLERALLAEQSGFAALWLRDVPFSVSTFGDAGHVFDPFAYLGFLAAQTECIALGVASIALSLRHSVHVMKAAASVDVLSGGRFIMGGASGDEPEEYPSMAIEYSSRGDRFRESYEYIHALEVSYPPFENGFGKLNGNIDVLPKSHSGQIPMLITGSSQQDDEWIAEQGNGWMTYPRPIALQAKLIDNYRALS